METAVCCIRESFTERERKGQLCYRTCRVRTCVIELLTVISSSVLQAEEVGRVLRVAIRSCITEPG
jgi:hypothetical protein